MAQIYIVESTETVAKKHMIEAETKEEAEEEIRARFWSGFADFEDWVQVTLLAHNIAINDVRFADENDIESMRDEDLILKENRNNG